MHSDAVRRDPSVNFLPVELHELANFNIRNLALTHELIDGMNRKAQIDGDLLDIEQPGGYG